MFTARETLTQELNEVLTDLQTQITALQPVAPTEVVAPAVDPVIDATVVAETPAAE